MFESLGKLGITIGTSVLTSLYYGWALMTIWGWFFVQGAGFAALPYVFWVGVPFLWGQLYTSTVPKPKTLSNDEETWFSAIGWSILKILVSLLLLGFAGIVFMLLV